MRADRPLFSLGNSDLGTAMDRADREPAPMLVLDPQTSRAIARGPTNRTT